MPTYDIMIIGSGIVGATAALALSQKTTLQIALLDAKKISSQWNKENYSTRVSALSLASQRIFQQLGVWDAMREKRISPYQKMHVWDENGSGQLNFDCAELRTDALGFIVEDEVTRSSLIEKLQHQKNVHLISPCKLISLQEKTDGIEIATEEQGVLQAKLLIAADGGNSWVREQAGIAIKNWNYQHEAIVATVQTSGSHEFTAWQRFLTTGPLAFLPLDDVQSCSIVWSATPEYAAELLALDDEAFQTALSEAFVGQLGDVTRVSARQRFPLEMRHAKNYVKPGLVLMGDAAHTIHPLAGQGVNLGLLDVACFMDVIVDAIAKKRDYTSLQVLRRYERWRKADNSAMLAFVEGIKCLFGSQRKPVQRLRNIGLTATNQIAFIKNFFANYAIGNRADMPRLAL